MRRPLLSLLMGSLLLAAPAAARETIIFDTDAGVFGDDGAALVMLMRSPRQVGIAGITLVAGNVWPRQGAEYIFHILQLLRRPLEPVYAGAQGPLINSPAMAK